MGRTLIWSATVRWSPADLSRNDSLVSAQFMQSGHRPRPLCSMDRKKNINVRGKIPTKGGTQAIQVHWQRKNFNDIQLIIPWTLHHIKKKLNLHPSPCKNDNIVNSIKNLEYGFKQWPLDSEVQTGSHMLCSASFPST